MKSWNLTIRLFLLLALGLFAASFPTKSQTAGRAALNAAPTASLRFGACPHGVIYVKQGATGANTGESWANAFTDLQAALACATGGDEIWVARGTYKPTAGTDRFSSFRLKNGVGIYGGFAGTETARNQRDPNPEIGAPNQTILSGDIGVINPLDSRDNSLHVLTSDNTDSTAILDGFMITAGYAADGLSPVDHLGGGLRNVNGKPTLRNLLFFRNSANNYGGGMYNGIFSSGQVSNPTLVNVTFRQNRAYFGGGLANEADQLFNPSFCSLDNVTFDNNRSTGGGGGGMYNSYATFPTLRNCLFKDNIATRDFTKGAGGAIFNDGSRPTIIGCTFINIRL